MVEVVVELPCDIWWLIFRKMSLKERLPLALVSHSYYLIFIEATTELDEFDMGRRLNNIFLSQFTNLRNLSLSPWSKITKDAIQNLTKLEQLSLSKNIHINNDIFRSLVNLKHLVINNNRGIVAHCLEGMTQLQSLSLFQNGNIGGPCLNNHFTHLTSLDLRYSIGTITLMLEFFTRLEKLKISDGCPKTYRSGAGSEIMIKHCREGFKSCINDKNLRKLTNLKNLDMDGDITELLSIDGFLTLTNLQKLTISTKNSINVNLLMKQLTNLTRLNYH